MRASSSSPSSTARGGQAAEVDHAGEGVERLRGADVGGGLLAADVLLAGLQREHEAAAAVHVDGFAGDAARHAAQVLLAGGEQAEGGTAEVEPVAERLPLADGHVDAAVPGRAQDPERERVDLRHHDRGAARGGLAGLLLGYAAERLGVLDGAVEVRLGEDRGAGVGVDGARPLLQVGRSVAQRDLDDLHPVTVGERAERLDRVRVQTGARDDLALAVVELGEIGGRGDRGGALVGGGVGDVQARELGDGRLVLEHHLQAALGDLGLVGRVGRQELRALHQHVDQRRDVVVVHAAAEEADLVLCARVPGGQRPQVLIHVLLGEAVGELELAAEAHTLGDLAVEDLLQAVHADRGEHPLQVLRGYGCVAAQAALQPSQPAWRDRRRRPGARLARRGLTASP